VHGFVRSSQGQIASFDASGSFYTEPTGINPSGTITGWYIDSNGVYDGFVRSPQGQIASFDPSGSFYTIAYSINPSGAITGWYADSNGVYHGFVRSPQGQITSFDPSGSINTAAVSINRSGAITGWYADSNSVYHGFVRSPQGQITSFDPSGSIKTAAFSINPGGAITGVHLDSISHGFVRGPQGQITSFDPSGSIRTVAYSINPSGAIAGYYFDSNDIGHGFVRNPQGQITSFDPSGSTDTEPVSINPSGAITGSYADSNDVRHGFVGTAPNAMDVSKYSGEISDSSWQSAIQAGASFVSVGGWGGLSRSGQAKSQLLGAKKNKVVGALYTLLNFLSYGGSGNYLGGGKYQVDQAVAAAGMGISNVKFIAIDVEPCCVTTSQWQSNHKYKQGSEIVDPSGNMQYTAKGGVSGQNPPTWNDSGGPTKDGTVVWQDYGVPLDQTDSLQVIRDAVSEAQAKNLKPVVYTSRNFWKTITGGCGTTTCSDLIALPLWDIENKTFVGGDGQKHCGDGIAGLVPFTPYPNSGWTFRSGNQYDLGLAVSGAGSEIAASLMKDNPAKGAGCQGDKFFNTEEDLDYFDPSLFQ